MTSPKEIKCADCPLRAKYDKNPKSFGGRFWRWHINWCPGWKAYMETHDEEHRNELASNYNLKKYLN